ncbi:MAG TPA: GvpL/GvpF family gas vesicle protein [Gemmatimonadaceae bacterium]|jgi:hypothetical protein
MATYLYCVLAPPKTEDFPTGLTGIAGAAVRAITTRAGAGLEAWVATVDESKLRASGSALARLALLHNEVIEAALATRRTPLPTRFGSCFADDEACLADLSAREDELFERLERVADAIEMSVLLVPIEGAVPWPAALPRGEEPSAGRRYLEVVRERTRAADERRAAADALTDRVTVAVSEVARDERRSLSKEPVAIAHLVRRADLEHYRRALAGVNAGPSLRIVVAGPRAPYSFASD